ADDRVVRELDLDRRRAVGIRVKVDSARVLHERAFLRAPCEHAVLLARRDDGIEVALRTCRAADGPAPALVITAGIDAAHAVNVRHELREALEVFPELEDTLDGRVDADALAHLDDAARRTDAEQRAELLVARRARREQRAARAEQ